MSACACPIILGDCIGVDSPITGISSLADDHCFFYASCSPRADAFAPPPLGGGFVTQQCAYTVLAGETQAEADALAAAACNGLPSPPPEPPPPPTPGEDLFICNATNFNEVVSPNIVGLEPPLSFSGNLFPPGINVTSDPGDPNQALVSGLTTTPGDFPDATVIVTDVTGQVQQTLYPTTVLGIINGPTLPDPSSATDYSVRLPDAACEVAYTCQLLTVGGAPPITFDYDPLVTPAWLSVSQGGIVSGTPPSTAAGLDWYVDVEMTDANGNQCVQTVVFFVKCTVDNPPDATQCVPYSEQLTSCPAAAPNGWSAPGGIPQGFILDGDGRLHGTPMDKGGIAFTVEVVTATITCTALVSLNVLPGGNQTNFQVHVPGLGGNTTILVGNSFDLGAFELGGTGNMYPGQYVVQIAAGQFHGGDLVASWTWPNPVPYVDQFGHTYPAMVYTNYGDWCA